MDEFENLRRFQRENEDEALAKALELSQLKDSPTSSSLLLLSCEDLQELQMQNDDEDQTLARAMALSLETLGDTMGNIQSATPLCLPNNHHWNARARRTTKTTDERRSLKVVEEGLEQLRRVKGPVCVVSVAGPYRKGKSYILSEAFDQPDVFPLGHTMKAETMGIWIWIVPEKFKNSNGQEFTVVLLDSEGIDATNTKNTDDHQIFTLTVLLASVLIYNSQGVPTRSDVEKLDYIAKLSKRIQVRSTVSGAYSPSQNSEFFHKTFPYFIWLLRDVLQRIPDDCKNIKEYFLKEVFNGQASSDADHKTEKGVAESILRFFPGFDAFALPPPTADCKTMTRLNLKKSEVNESFWLGLKKFKSVLKDTLSPKNSFNDGEFVTGEGLAAMVQLYVDAINAPDAIPNVQSAWNAFVEGKCAEAKQSSLYKYDALITARLSDALPCSNSDIRMCHNDALEECEDHLATELVGISTNSVEMTSREFQLSVEEKLLSWLTKNEELTRQSCEVLLANLKEIYLDPVFDKLLGEEGVKVSFEDIIERYQSVKDDYHKNAVGAEDVIAAVFLKLHKDLLKEKEQYLGILTQLKDFDEERSRELAARAYQEQERKRLEEQQARLQQENLEQKKQMEMLIKNLDEEKRRFADQRNGERKAHQDQLQNMMEASMRQAQQERQAFMRENKVFQERFLAIQERNEANMKMVQNLSDRAAQQEKEREALRQQMKDQADQDKEDLLKAMNDKHDEEMKALRDEVNARSNEVAGKVPPDEIKSEETAGLINKRTREAEERQRNIAETRKKQQEVEKPGFWKKALKFVGKIVPLVGTAVSAFVPPIAAVAAPVGAAVGVVCEAISDHACSIM